MNRLFTLSIATIFISACAHTNVTPLSQNQFILSTSAAPACGKTGAGKVAVKMAAVETLRRGYPRFMVLGVNNKNNVSVVQTQPTYSNTNGTYTVQGNQIIGNTTTTYGGGGPLITGSHDADLHVVMLKKGDKGFSNAIDSKVLLGENWQKNVANGIQTCVK
jgi:hypothetical protein